MSPYLGISQHDILDLGQPPGLSVLHAYIVDLVAANLAMLAVLDWRAPEHLDCSGVQDLHLHFPRRSTGHCEEGKKGIKSHLGISVWSLSTYGIYSLHLWDIRTLNLQP